MAIAQIMSNMLTAKKNYIEQITLYNNNYYTQKKECRIQWQHTLYYHNLRISTHATKLYNYTEKVLVWGVCGC